MVRRLGFLWALLGTVLIAPVQAAEVTVDPSKQYQLIDGFGTCLIGWDSRMGEWYKRPESVQAYADELRFNILRCNLSGSGTIGPKADPADIKHTDPEFAAKNTHTRIFVRFAQDLLKRNPDARIIGTVWSPPPWMKEIGTTDDTRSGAINGLTYQSRDAGEIRNRVKRDHYPHFARWVVEMVKYYRERGVKLYAVSCANEPQFTQTFDSCVWTAEDLATITEMTIKQLEKEGLGEVKVFGPETMTGFNWQGGPNRAYTQALRENETVYRNLAFFATHGYSDGVQGDVSKNSSAQFWEIIKGYDRPFWITEGGTGGHTMAEAIGEKGVAAALHNAFVAGNASAFVPWQFAENARTEHHLMRLDGFTKKTHVVRHFSRYIPAGSQRIDATSAYGEVSVSAYAGPKQKTLTIVLINPSDSEQPIELTLKGEAPAKPLTTIRTSANEDSKVLNPTPVKDGRATLALPPQSIVTLTTLPE